jgi:hypothetical protein
MELRGFILIADITLYPAYLNGPELEHAQEPRSGTSTSISSVTEVENPS